MPITCDSGTMSQSAVLPSMTGIRSGGNWKILYSTPGRSRESSGQVRKSRASARMAPRYRVNAIQWNMNRRTFLGSTALLAASAQTAEPKKIAAIITEYRPNSHADVIVGKYLEGYNQDDRPPY